MADMNPTARILLAAILAAVPVNARPAEAPSALARVAAPEATAAPLRVAVDQRVELMSLIFRLAGNPEYSRGRVESYNLDAERHFNRFRDHAVVKLARELRRTSGVSYDACMSLAVHLDNAEKLQPVVPSGPGPRASTGAGCPRA